MATGEELYGLHEQRIRDAVALKKPDRVPVVPNGPAWPGRALRVPISEIATNPPVSRQTIVDAYNGLGEIEGIQSPAYHVCTLSIQWLSRVKRPGRELPADELWQVDEAELMKLEDYDKIVEQGFGPWLESYYRTQLPGVLEEMGTFVQTIPDALKLCRDRGLVPMTPAVATIPYEYFCGRRSMKEFLLDLFRHGDKVQASCVGSSLPIAPQRHEPGTVSLNWICSRGGLRHFCNRTRPEQGIPQFAKQRPAGRISCASVWESRRAGIS